jgi:iron complex outermembrane receptor protein
VANTLTATRTDIPIKELPINITIIGQQFMQDTFALTDYEAQAYTTKVSGRDFRGIRSRRNLRNGFEWTDIQNSLSVERVEIIGGPAAVQYGVSAPGGIAIAYSKRPDFSADRHRLTASAGRWDFHRFTVDANQRVSDRVAYRVNLGYANYYGEEGDAARLWVDGNEQSSRVAAASFAFKLTPRTELVIEAEHAQRREAEHASAGLMTTTGDNFANGQLPLAISHGVALAATFDPEGTKSQDNIPLVSFATLTHRFGDRLQVQAQVHTWKRSNQRVFQSAFGRQFRVVGGVTEHGANFQRFQDNNERLAWIVSGVYDFELAAAKHKIFAGYQFTETEGGRSEEAHDSDPANPNADRRRFVPVTLLQQGRSVTLADYGFPSTSANFQTRGAAITANDGETLGLYATHHAKWFGERLITQAGVFHTSIESVNRNPFATPAPTRTVTDNSRTSPQLGLLWRLRPDVYAFALYSTSLQAQGGFSPLTHEPWDPLYGEGWEGGLKFDLLGTRLSGTVSAYAIKEKNRIVNDPLQINPDTGQPGLPVQAGELTSEGFDAEIFLNLTDAWSGIFSYSYNKVFRSFDFNPALIGRLEAGRVPHKVAFFNKYSFRGGALRGLELAGGVRWEDERVRAFRNNAYATNRAFWNGDAMAAYGWRAGRLGYRVQANVRNAFAAPLVAGWKPGRNEGYTFDSPREFYLTFSLEY